MAQDPPVFPFRFWGAQEGKPFATPILNDDQTILDIAQAAYLGTATESFLFDREAVRLSDPIVKFYRQSLQPFYTYCNDNALKLVQYITPDFQGRCVTQSDIDMQAVHVRGCPVDNGLSGPDSRRGSHDK